MRLNDKTFCDNSGFNYQCNFNPLHKVVNLYDEKVALLERLLKTEQDKVRLLEEVLKKRK